MQIVHDKLKKKMSIIKKKEKPPDIHDWIKDIHYFHLSVREPKVNAWLRMPYNG